MIRLLQKPQWISSLYTNALVLLYLKKSHKSLEIYLFSEVLHNGLSLILSALVLHYCSYSFWSKRISSCTCLGFPSFSGHELRLSVLGHRILCLFWFGSRICKWIFLFVGDDDGFSFGDVLSEGVRWVLALWRIGVSLGFR